uniref:NADH-ubiquinone oxidoreductase chain 6 n=1 Tax=Peripatoides sympatrica TaxID=123609 RepID=G1CDT8_9BILA|nr:NADH dehydrogenase subunit 6 [Peripatoides sympatrica]
MLMLNLSIIMIGFTFTFMNHPLSMGLMIMLQVILICIIMGIYSMNFWFSYMLFLIFLGGLLVLFIYISSLAENELFMFYNKWLNKIFCLILIMLILISNLSLNFNLNYYNLDSMEKMKLLDLKMHFLFTHFYSSSIWKITIFLSIYLLLCLLIVTKICQLNKGPMRQKF